MYPSRRLRLDVASVASEILVSIVRCLFRIAPLLLADLFMAGCAPSHYSKGITSFAAAARARAGQGRRLLHCGQRRPYNAYWDVKDAALKQQLLALFGNISEVSTKLNQEDLQSRDDEFKNAANAMSEKVLPGIKQLTKSAAEIAMVEGTLKTTMSDLVKVSASIGFFGIPAL